MGRRRLRLAFSWAASAWLLCVGAPARGQAFVPAKGEGTVTISFQDALVTRHLAMLGSFDAGQIRSKSLYIDFSLGLGRGLALSVSMPYIGAKYTGTKPHNDLTPAELALHPTFVMLDAGAYHSTWQDLRVDVRYNLTKKWLTLTPFITTITPSHDYECLGHAAVGRDVRELQVGAFAARLLDPWLPGAFIQARVSHGFEQQIAGVSRGRTMATLEGGYFVTSSLRVFGVAAGQVTNGGIYIQVSPRKELQGEFYVHHDQIQHEDLFNAGVGAAYSVSGSIDVFGSFIKTIWGINAHALNRGVSVGLSYGFGQRKNTVSESASAGDTACHMENQLGKCICLKK